MLIYICFNYYICDRGDKSPQKGRSGMAKLSATFRQENLEKVLGVNKKAFLFPLNGLSPCEELPEDILQLLPELPRINSVRVLSWERFTGLTGDVTYYGDKSADKVGLATMPFQGKPFPTAYLYAPGWSELAERRRMDAVKERNVTIIRTKLEKSFGLPLDKEMEGIIKTMPEKLPDRIFFEGCEIRFQNLCHQVGATLYPEDRPQAVVRTSKKDGKVTWTFFIAAIDYRRHFSARLQTELNIKAELADRIANNWKHDSYVAVNPQAFMDPMAYATEMAENIGQNNGSVVDLLQGPVNIESNKGRSYLDIDADEPSAVIVKGRLHLYLPTKSE